LDPFTEKVISIREGFNLCGGDKQQLFTGNCGISLSVIETNDSDHFIATYNNTSEIIKIQTSSFLSLKANQAEKAVKELAHLHYNQVNTQNISTSISTFK
jgi:hypothetical protein